MDMVSENKGLFQIITLIQNNASYNPIFPFYVHSGFIRINILHRVVLAFLNHLTPYILKEIFII